MRPRCGFHHPINHPVIETPLKFFSQTLPSLFFDLGSPGSILLPISPFLKMSFQKNVHKCFSPFEKFSKVAISPRVSVPTTLYYSYLFIPLSLYWLAFNHFCFIIELYLFYTLYRFYRFNFTPFWAILSAILPMQSTQIITNTHTHMRSHTSYKL